MKIVWDEPKRRATLVGRGLDFAMVTPDFFAAATIQTAKDGRYLALGLIGDRPYAVVFGDGGYISHQLAPGERQGKAHPMSRRDAEKAPLTEAEIAARDEVRGFTDADLAEVMDNPEWTDAQLRDARPFAEVFPEMAASIRRLREAKKV